MRQIDRTHMFAYLRFQQSRRWLEEGGEVCCALGKESELGDNEGTIWIS